FKAIDNKPTIREADNAKPLVVAGGEVRLQDVCFNYNEAASTLHEVNLVVPAGKMVALVGASGSGKTTLMNLLLRFYDVNSGQILIDGQDIREVTLASLRGAIA
ncbi:MAG: ATP-binding cassette domain-containing protein, partial [Flammeovirgaceae bacterium]